LPRIKIHPSSKDEPQIAAYCERTGVKMGSMRFQRISVKPASCHFYKTTFW